MWVKVAISKTKYLLHRCLVALPKGWIIGSMADGDDLQWRFNKVTGMTSDRVMFLLLTNLQ